MSGVLGYLAFIYGGEALRVSSLPAVNKVGLQIIEIMIDSAIATRLILGTFTKCPSTLVVHLTSPYL